MSHWQIAADGVYEKARQVRLQPDAQELNELSTWVSNASEDIAIEAFFGDKGQDFFFLGVRIEHLSKAEQASFVTSLIGEISEKDDLGKVVESLQEGLQKTHLLDTKPALLELGADDFWGSYGSYVVWNKGNEAVASIEEIGENASQLLIPFKRAIMMEFAWKEPLPMWLAIPVSTRIGNERHQFSPSRYDELSRAIS